MTSSAPGPALNNSYLGMLSSSLSSTLTTVSTAPLGSWFGGSSSRRGAFIKTAAGAQTLP